MKKEIIETVTHDFAPVWDKASRVLILGTIPSPASREQGFYYGHPRNRFWRVISSVFKAEMPSSIAEKKVFLHTHHIALFDVLQFCEITGASDSSIKNPVPNDLSHILEQSEIRAIFTTGRKAYTLYERLLRKQTKQPAIYLPSTSPANAAYSEEKLIAAYQKIWHYVTDEKI
ncbi:MAG: DNA-deoxyinosine glycosylase [Christensenellaceae bacterium]|jgi:hypoxanthine-DNA glycosylase